MTPRARRPARVRSFHSVARTVSAAAGLALVGVVTAASIQTLPDDAAPRPPEGSLQAVDSDQPSDATSGPPGVEGAALELPGTPRSAGQVDLPILGHVGLPALLVPPGRQLPDLVRTARLADIPDDALAAYQRGARIISVAQPDCGLDWTILAAVGLIASNHGAAAREPATSRTSRTSRNSRTARPPAITGAPLRSGDGRPVADTDGGRFDLDRHTDRPVGPMMLPPATWSVVSVDADDDGHRDPQDLDDAVLAAAVLMCAPTGADEAVPVDASAETAVRAAAARYARQEATRGSLPASVPSPGQIREVNDAVARATPTAHQPSPAADASSPASTPPLPRDPARPSRRPTHGSPSPACPTEQPPDVEQPTDVATDLATDLATDPPASTATGPTPCPGAGTGSPTGTTGTPPAVE